MQASDVIEILDVDVKTLLDFNPTDLMPAVQARWAGADRPSWPCPSGPCSPCSVTCTAGKAMATLLGEIKADTR